MVLARSKSKVTCRIKSQPTAVVRSRRTALTLIEVVAATALMGTLLTLTIVAGSRHIRQMKAADDKRTATRMLDAFLSSWATNDFHQNSIEKAVLRSGLSATGHFGSYIAPESNHKSNSPRWRVAIQRTGGAEFANKSKLRLTVFQRTAGAKDWPLAWAEVIAEL